MSLRYKSNCDLLWTERKLILNHILLNFPHKPYYRLDDFRIPRYPQTDSINKESCEDILREISSYEDIGIKIKDIFLNREVLQLYSALQSRIPKRYQDGILNFDVKHILKLPKWIFKLFAPYIRIVFATNPKQQQKAEKLYLKKYLANGLKSRDGIRVLGSQYVEKFFKYALSHFSLLDGRNLHFRLLGAIKSESQYLDQFIRVLADFAPMEFSLWHHGKLQIRFIEHLLVWVALRKKLSITDFTIQSAPGVHSEVQVKILPRIPDPEGFFAIPIDSRVVRLIEILEPDDGKRFSVFVNHDYQHPFVFRKNEKAGQVIYALAKNGSIDFNDLRSTYDYLSQPRFRFFNKDGRYSHTSILDKLKEYDEHGNLEATFIVPNKNVQFRMTSKEKIEEYYKG